MRQRHNYAGCLCYSLLLDVAHGHKLHLMANNNTPRRGTVALPKLLTIQQAADHVGLDPRAIRRRISEGDLVAYRVGPRAIRVDAESLLALLRPVVA